MRATTLTCFQRRKQSDRDGDKRLKIFRKHLENSCKLHNIDRKVQIEVLIGTIPACEMLAPVTSNMQEYIMMEGSRRTKGWADKYTIANATDHMLHRRYDGYFNPLYLLHEHGGEVFRRTATYLHRPSGCYR